MARFDVYRLADGSYALDCQADGLSHLNTRLAVALWPPEEAPIAAARLNPAFEVEGRSVIMITQFAAALPITQLRDRVTSLADEHYKIVGALDFLTGGF